jgi:hypothetical protein
MAGKGLFIKITETFNRSKTSHVLLIDHLSTELDMDSTGDDSKKRKVDSTPPDGYVCRLCSVAGMFLEKS